MILYYCLQTRKSGNKINMENHRYPYHNHIYSEVLPNQTVGFGNINHFKQRICLLGFRLNLKIQQTMHVYVLQSELSRKQHMNNKTPLSLSSCCSYQCLGGDMFAVAVAHIFNIFGEYSVFLECLANFHLLTACHVDIFLNAVSSKV